MMQELLNSSTDGHKVTSLSAGTSTGILANTIGNVSVLNNNAAISGGAGSSGGCGWNDPIVAYPSNPCGDVVFPTVSVVNIGGFWHLQLNFDSCNNICNEWSFSFSAYMNTGAATISVDCSTLPYIYNIGIDPVGIPDHSVGHYGTINPTYDYTLTNHCQSYTNSKTGSITGSITVTL